MQTIHAFEARGLGNAPFRYIGMTEKVHVVPGGTPKAAGTCAYCGTGIRYCYAILSADGIVSEVGSECVNKTGDAGLQRKVAASERAVAAAKRQSKATASVDALDLLLTDEESRAWLAFLPHPTPSFAADGACLGAYVGWMLEHCGAAGRARLLKMLRE